MLIQDKDLELATIQEKIKKPLSDELLFGKISKSGGKVSFDLGKSNEPVMVIRAR